MIETDKVEQCIQFDHDMIVIIKARLKWLDPSVHFFKVGVMKMRAISSNIKHDAEKVAFRTEKHLG
jgi:hypothetical protein